jgi:hypothetical protein
VRHAARPGGIGPGSISAAPYQLLGDPYQLLGDPYQLLGEWKMKVQWV